jgi:predicted RNase H-like nuclease (RuvC/YqgF family)
MNDKLLIVGIDPGITAAYAALDTKGELIKLKSAKHLNLNTIIAELTQTGKVVVVGTDVKHSPKFVEKFCSRLGAKLLKPKDDMKVGFKKRVTKSFRCRDAHQRDALAAALFAHQEVKPLLTKINKHLKQVAKEHLIYDTTLLVLKGLSINDALAHLEEKKEKKITKKRVRNKVKKSTHLRDKNTRLIYKNKVLQKRLHETETKLDLLSQKFESLLNHKLKKTIEIKNHQIIKTQAQLLQHQKEMDILKEKVSDLNNILFSTDHNIIVKRIKNLGWDEIRTKITSQDRIILVNNPNEFSEKSLDYMKDKVETIICSITPTTTIKNKPFNIISSKNLDIEQRENFAVVNKESVEQEKKKSDLLYKIVQEYQDERRTDI